MLYFTIYINTFSYNYVLTIIQIIFMLSMCVYSSEYILILITEK